MPVQVRLRAPTENNQSYEPGRRKASYFYIYGGTIMKKLIALLLVLTCLFGSAMSESLSTITDLIEIDDDDFGQIDPSLLERKVILQWLKEPTYLGEEVTLVAILVDFLPTDVYTFRWEYRISEEDEWRLIEDETQQTYTFIINENNYYYWWHVIVILEGD